MGLLQGIDLTGDGLEHLITLPGLGAGGVVVLVVIMVLTGRLVPRYLYRLIVEDRDQWRSIAMSLTQQNQELMVSTRVSTKLLDSAMSSDRSSNDSAS